VAVSTFKATFGAATLDVPLGSPTRPSWRGRFHLAALLAAVPLFALLAIDVNDTRTRIGVALYAAGLCAMFLVSTTYHRWVHTLRARAIWRRADHATIFVAIAATTTPVCLALTPAIPWWRLGIVWTLAAAGVMAKLVGGRRGNSAGNALYIANGWVGALMVPALWVDDERAAVVLLVVGGLVYTGGAAGFARRWPSLRANVFGYHEVWHIATVVAAGAHFGAVWLITT